MNSTTDGKKTESGRVRDEFDTILTRHISRLVESRSGMVLPSLNLVTLSLLHLIAERENEILFSPGSPPDRHNLETLLADAKEFGIDLDDNAMTAIRDLEMCGAVLIDNDSRYTATASASQLIKILDVVFPQMQGMNLVAYIIQTIDEVLSGRKDLGLALRQFDQTLNIQGVRLPADADIERDESPTPSEPLPAHQKPDPKILQARRDAQLRKLHALRKKNPSTVGARTIVSGAEQLKNVYIRDLFPPKGASNDPHQPPIANVLTSDEAPSPETPPQETDKLPADQAHRQPSETPDVLTSSPPALQTAKDEIQVSTPQKAESLNDEILKTDKTAAPLSTDDTLPEKSESFEGDVLKTDKPKKSTSTENTAPEAENFLSDTPETDKPENLLSNEEAALQQIRRHEEEPGTPCPVCSSGNILSDTTEKGKTYYYCSNESCKMISWGKPHPVKCPDCDAPFLIEVPGIDGRTVLNCPRATCSYQKKASEMMAPDEKKRTAKRKVGKKVRKKRVRRVVRRKK